MTLALLHVSDLALVTQVASSPAMALALLLDLVHELAVAPSCCSNDCAVGAGSRAAAEGGATANDTNDSGSRAAFSSVAASAAGSRSQIVIGLVLEPDQL